jgi:hypothetical protein
MDVKGNAGLPPAAKLHRRRIELLWCYHLASLLRSGWCCLESDTHHPCCNIQRQNSLPRVGDVGALGAISRTAMTIVVMVRH